MTDYTEPREVEAESEHFKLWEESKSQALLSRLVNAFVPIGPGYTDKMPVLEFKFHNKQHKGSRLSLWLDEAESEKLKDLIEGNNDEAVIDHLNANRSVDYHLPEE